MFGFFRDRRRAAIRSAPFPTAYRDILERGVVFYRLLDDAERRRLEELIAVFLAEKNFEGCGGLTLTDEMRVVIAAEACLLELHREPRFYPDLDSVLVYPSAYVAPTALRDGPVVIEGGGARLGESWTRGTVIVAWDHVKAEARTLGTGNVVLHEFAHQLDAEDGEMDGAPALPSRERYARWARVLGADYQELVDRLDAGKRTELDPYAATNPAEFFAVATEAFFEHPRRMRARMPDLYEELAKFYGQDPAAR